MPNEQQVSREEMVECFNCMSVFLKKCPSGGCYQNQSRRPEIDQAIRAALMAVKEWEERAEAALIESNENLKVEKAMSLIEDIRDFGQGKGEGE